VGFLLLTVLLSTGLLKIDGQRRGSDNRVRTVAVPVSIFTKDELRRGKPEELLLVDNLTVKENGEEKQILSIRSVTDAPLALAILIQDDVSSAFNLQIRDLANFIRSLPQGSRVMVAYIVGGSLQIRQRFTTDLDRASRALRIVTSSSSVSPRNPYDGVVEALNRFDALPAGRRAMILISDGVDRTLSPIAASPSQSADLDRAILRAQRRSVSIFSIYHGTVLTENGNSQRILFGQSSLLKLSDETGGRAFFQGSISPINFDPFFKDLSLLLNRQFLLTYLSDNMRRGYYTVEITSSSPGVKIEHPRGYYYR
jgi:VWFA-related protein